MRPPIIASMHRQNPMSEIGGRNGPATVSVRRTRAVGILCAVLVVGPWGAAAGPIIGRPGMLTPKPQEKPDDGDQRPLAA
jgi:hypothetical protein